MKEKAYCILAGGCFWCMAKPYYQYEGIEKVFSGYTGGKEENPTYEQVKRQETGHKEAIKIIYDEKIIKYKDILNVYFQTIDPFDFGGQYIDRGSSYTCAIFYQDNKMQEIAIEYITQLEEKYNKKCAVELLEENEFYIAEEYHQDYALKNPEAMEKELRESGRKK